MDISFEEINKHTHKDKKEINISKDIIMTEKEIQALAIKLLIANINEPLEFHIDNFNNNKIKWKIGRIRKLLYSIIEEKFPKEEEFLNSINNITILLSNNNENIIENFCICKGDFIDFNKNKKLEKYIIFTSFV